MSLIGAFLAVQATNELANSALPDAPVRPDPPKRRPGRRLIDAAARIVQGIRASAPAGRSVGRVLAVRRGAGRPAADDGPGRVWESPETSA
ncbi:hypothetical protein GCM10009744_18760 [Kribbella alba]|uniref:Uncharacterized protein n=1 Tax=Kribbella alba TaxID=190197 RepID=A0ABN2F4W7_9ACTN